MVGRCGVPPALCCTACFLQATFCCKHWGPVHIICDMHCAPYSDVHHQAAETASQALRMEPNTGQKVRVAAVQPMQWLAHSIPQWWLFSSLQALVCLYCVCLYVYSSLHGDRFPLGPVLDANMFSCTASLRQSVP
jgi:hypothetical protein